MSVSGRLLQQALIGTAHGHAELPDLTEDLRTALPDAEIEQRLLLAAGIFAVYREAGRLPAQRPLPQAAPTDDARQPSPQVQSIIDECLQGEWDPWWPRAAERLARHGYAIRTERLVATLNKVKPRDAALWRPLLGARGRWLAAQNPEWSWAMDDAIAPNRQQQWLEGNIRQRVAALVDQRKEDAAIAREWVSEAWKGEKVDARQALLESIGASLSVDDAAFLDACLTDRSQGVRAIAAGLLARLPDSALARRLAERAQAWVNWQPAQGALGKMAGKLTGTGGALEIEPPTAWDKNWAKDGFEEKPPQGEGARASWLRQLVSLIPPGLWQAHTGLPPDAFIKAALASDWADAVVMGLIAAVQHFRDADWALALYRGLPDKAELWPHRQALLIPLIDPARREALCLDRLRSGSVRAPETLGQCATPWSDALNQAVARALTDALRAAAKKRPEGSEVLALAEQAALNLPADMLTRLGEAWQEAQAALESQTEDWRARSTASQLRRLLELVERRMTFDKEVAP